MSETFEHTSIQRLRLHVLPTTQFKTNTISLHLGFPLQESTVTAISYLAHIMRRASGAFPHPANFREQLETMYGAGFSVDVQKRADYQFIVITLEVVRDHFSLEQQTLFKDALRFLFDCVFRPAFEHDRFQSILFAQERTTIQNKLQANKNDKILYAANRCIEEMSPNHPIRFSALGIEHQLDEWDELRLYRFYQEWIQQAKLDLYIVGDRTLNELEQMVHDIATQYEQFVSSTTSNDESLLDFPLRNAIHEVTETIDVKQTKLNFGLRTSISIADDRYPALQLYNGILGGFAHSKLFAHVRERHSLAYYVSSRMIDPSLGLLMIQSGIQADQSNAAKDIIQQQLQAMRIGDISELELSQTKSLMINGLRSLRDSAIELISFEFSRQFHQAKRSISQAIRAIEVIQRDEIQTVAEQVVIDTIFVLQKEERS